MFCVVTVVRERERKKKKFAKHCLSKYPYMSMFLFSSHCTKHTIVKSPCQSLSRIRITNKILPPPPARNITLVRSLRRVCSTSCPHNGPLTKSRMCSMQGQVSPDSCTVPRPYNDGVQKHKMLHGSYTVYIKGAFTRVPQVDQHR